MWARPIKACSWVPADNNFNTDYVFLGIAPTAYAFSTSPIGQQRPLKMHPSPAGHMDTQVARRIRVTEKLLAPDTKARNTKNATKSLVDQQQSAPTLPPAGVVNSCGVVTCEPFVPGPFERSKPRQSGSMLSLLVIFRFQRDA
ncbi:hypothetical protein EVAR_29865_1 [Eumeta japonica]|uniref:Uncharacterized protein n=1 Tax=Eumeta variegata TaxID=151549 RepID=A0A4C1V7E6_EUMVA|nr:hypothetical protein EVAR_29865_1 [Eumeta japonica]